MFDVLYDMLDGASRPLSVVNKYKINKYKFHILHDDQTNFLVG